MSGGGGGFLLLLLHLLSLPRRETLARPLDRPTDRPRPGGRRTKDEGRRRSWEKYQSGSDNSPQVSQGAAKRLGGFPPLRLQRLWRRREGLSGWCRPWWRRRSERESEA